MNVRVELNEPAIQAVCDDLEIPVPRVLTVTDTRDTVFGSADKDGHIRINTNHDYFRNPSLRLAQLELQRTLLHELRHIHQYRHWPKERQAVPLMELDAREFELAAQKRYPVLARLHRTSYAPGRGFSALNAAERSAK